jgi:N-acetylmuramoyl-L-alanine amidase
MIKVKELKDNAIIDIQVNKNFYLMVKAASFVILQGMNIPEKGDDYFKQIVNNDYNSLDEQQRAFYTLALLLAEIESQATKNNLYIEKEIPEPLFEKMKTKNMAVWINGKVKTKEEIKKYKRTDFIYYNYSFVHKNARSKRFPQEYQYTLYTKDYFDENLKDSHIHFKGDTIKIGIIDWKKAKESKVMKLLGKKTDSLKSYSIGKRDNVKEHKNKRIIVIDAGHGGKDFGAKINDEIESKIVESISKKIKLLNVKDEIEIVLLREDDSFIGLNERLEKINKINTLFIFLFV